MNYFNIKCTFLRILLNRYPLMYGQDRLSSVLNLPIPDKNNAICKIKNFPLFINYNPKTYLGRQLFYFGCYEPGICNVVSKLLSPGDVFLDVGANYGLYSLIAAHIVGNTGRVIAFEPQKKLREFINNSLKINNFNNVDVSHYGLSDIEYSGKLLHPSTTNDGQATLKISSNEKCFDSELIPIRTLDSFLKNSNINKISGLKIDIEGAELRALIGAMSIFSRNEHPKFVVFECIEKHLNRFEDSIDALINFFNEINYTVMFYKKGVFHEYNKDKHVKAGFPSDMIAFSPQIPGIMDILK